MCSIRSDRFGTRSKETGKKKLPFSLSQDVFCCLTWRTTMELHLFCLKCACRCEYNSFLYCVMGCMLRQILTSFGSVGFGRLDTTLATVGSETQTHGICAPVQTPVVGSESRVPEKEPKLVVKTDLRFQVKPTFSSVSKNVLEKRGGPLMLETSRGQSASHLQILLVFFLCKCRLTPY